MDLPIVCTLDDERLRAWRSGTLDRVVAEAEAKEVTETGVRFRFAARDGLLEDLARVLETERRCCQFLRFTIEVEPGLGPIHLDVSGPPEARALIVELLGGSSD